MLGALRYRRLKKQKLERPRIPWWSWDVGYDLPPWKGAWKKIYNKITRCRGKRTLQNELKDFPE